MKAGKKRKKAKNKCKTNKKPIKSINKKFRNFHFMKTIDVKIAIIFIKAFWLKATLKKRL